MSRIQGQSGASLADVYDVRGSIASIETLLSKEINLTHEMGGTLQSERLSGDIRRVSSAATGQNAVFSVGLPPLPSIPCRILAIVVFVDVTSRILNCAVSVSDENALQELPIWAWDTTNESTLRFFDDGAEGNQICLNGDLQYAMLPSFTFGEDQPQSVESLVMRGTTSGFGAGTVTVTLLVYIAFADIKGLTSYGLPIPSW